MSKIFTVAAFAVVGLLIVGGAAHAQDAGTSCKPLAEDGCKAASACRWTAAKVLQLPNGQQVTVPGVCRFKPGVAGALKAAAAK